MLVEEKMEETDETNNRQDSLTAGTAATGCAVKIYFDYANESKEQIEQKLNLCLELAQKGKIVKDSFPK